MKKRRIELFELNDYEAIEKHLSNMAKKGWFLENIGTLFWTYGKGEPQNLTYEVTYFSEASEFNSHPTDNQQLYYEYCRAAGWDLVASNGKLQIFSTPRENPTAIESDEALKIKSIHRSMKKSLIPTYAGSLIFGIFLIIMLASDFTRNPIGFFSSSYSNILVFLYAISIEFYTVYLLIDYGSWYRGTKKAIALGIKYQKDHRKGKRRVQLATLFLVLIITLIGGILGLFSKYWWIFAIVIAMTAIIILIFFGTRRLMKKTKSSGRINAAVTLGVAIITIVALSVAMLNGIKYLAESGTLERRAHSSYSFIDNHGYKVSREVYKDSLPLTLEDLNINIQDENYSYKLEQEDSFAVKRTVAKQKAPLYSYGLPGLYYEIADVKLQRLYDTFKDYYLTKYEDYGYGIFVLASEPSWGAEEVYQMVEEGALYYHYLLCYEDKIVELILGFPPEQEHIEAIRERLMRKSI